MRQSTDRCITKLRRTSRFRSRERLTMIPFSSGVVGRQEFVIDATDSQSQEMTAVRSYVEGLSARDR